ncbi:unnamed protein product [Boreogadus saida]
MEDEDRGTAPPRDGSATGTRPKAATSKPSTPVVEDRTDRLERIVKSVVEYQRRQHDQAEAEFFRQDQRAATSARDAWLTQLHFSWPCHLSKPP